MQPLFLSYNMGTNSLPFALCLFIFIIRSLADDGFCSKAFGCSEGTMLGKKTRYILYDINFGEGFNLKRDVYMRMAMFVRGLAKQSRDDWHLVLPPWTKQWHWKREHSDVSYLWRNFFDVSSLQIYSPVIEMDQFFVDYSDSVEEVYILQHFPEFYEWKGGSSNMDWSERWTYADCRDSPYWKQQDGTSKFFKGKFRLNATDVKCISFHGSSAFLESVVNSSTATSLMFDRAEIPTHISFGDRNYWMCRRSMRFAEHLVQFAKVFRASYLNSSDERDGTVRPLDWREERPHRSTLGGPYLGVHLRRQDFIYGRPNEVPSLDDTVGQIKKHLVQLDLKTVFVATDMAAEEYSYLRKSLDKTGVKAMKYSEVNSENSQLGDGELAIIDQIIASHARFFIGTHESTFSFRIQEEREIMGFPPHTTFNRFCPSSSKDCTPPSKWLIKYPGEDSWSSSNNNRRSFEVDEL